MTEKLSLAMVLVAEYATKKNWLPIGDRSFTVGEFDVRVNGTPVEVDGIPPWHVRADHRLYMGMLLFSPAGGGAIGFQGTEDEFIETLKEAIEKA